MSQREKHLLKEQDKRDRQANKLNLKRFKK